MQAPLVLSCEGLCTLGRVLLEISSNYTEK